MEFFSCSCYKEQMCPRQRQHKGRKASQGAGRAGCPVTAHEPHGLACPPRHGAFAASMRVSKPQSRSSKTTWVTRHKRGRQQRHCDGPHHDGGTRAAGGGGAASEQAVCPGPAASSAASSPAARGVSARPSGALRVGADARAVPRWLSGDAALRHWRRRLQVARAAG